ncbi:MAG: SAM-dependent methyltransferase [Zoogloeaceae bacterium]|nr:SAM-dependent methyltransferase [Zoogloeaceae bacterium]
MTGTPTGQLYLIPVSLGEAPCSTTVPDEVRRITGTITDFIVENAKTARQELKRLGHPGPLHTLDITALEDTLDDTGLDALLAPALKDGRNIGLMSEAGCPAVADPGARLVARAHVLGVPVRPLVGPSSILLGLMGSGLNGQSFAFHGYLPVDEAALARRLRELENESRAHGRTQLFIETPYRNERLYRTLVATCHPGTRLCLAKNLTTAEEWIQTRSIGAWRREPAPSLARQPTLFLLLAS